jgi:NAD(P)-dependent dehydrogenase (short-subunit alcohol dehydrogenase family)
VALVTGGGTGIGRAAALTFARKGAAVILAARREAPLYEVAEAITEFGGTATVLPTDVSDEVAIRGLIDATVAQYGRLHLKHQIAAMRAAGNGGAIVNTSSIAATGGTPGLSVYAASKAALDAMTRVLALETGADRIRINNVSPGLTITPINEGLPSP